jgi:hypothetical protein
MRTDWRAKALELFPDMSSEIESADRLGRFWCDLSGRFQQHYETKYQDNSTNSPGIIRSICLYAIWCTGSDSFKIREPALIEFYQAVPRFALNCKPSIYKSIIDDLVANLGISDLETKSGDIGYSMDADEKKKFIADARQAELERQRRSRKR